MTLEEIQSSFLLRPAAARVRGEPGIDLSGDLAGGGLDELSEEDRARIVKHGLEWGLDLHRFKRTMELPRVRLVLGSLRGFRPESLLDIGPGRGAFLWPLLDSFPKLPAVCLEPDPNRWNAISTVIGGGLTQLIALQEDITEPSENVEPVDVATALEVLEHIPEVEKAIENLVRLSRRAVIVSVPSREDDNPEHIHLLGRDRLEASFGRHDRVRRVHFESVPGHLIAVVTLSEEGES